MIDVELFIHMKHTHTTPRIIRKGSDLLDFVGVWYRSIVHIFQGHFTGTGAIQLYSNQQSENEGYDVTN